MSSKGGSALLGAIIGGAMTVAAGAALPVIIGMTIAGAKIGMMNSSDKK